MSSSKRPSRISGAALLVALACTALAGACTVTPLYSDGGPGTPGTGGAALGNVSVEEVDTRYAQEVRNHLIFLLSGGAGDPANAPYRLRLSVAKRTISAATIQPVTAREREPTAGRVIMNATYLLVDAATGQPVARGTRQAAASFDRQLQEFAVVRAERDAENRAARELAEMVRLAIAQKLLRQ